MGENDPTGGPGKKSEKTFEVVVKELDMFEKVEWIGKESLVKFIFSDKEVYAVWDGVRLPINVTGVVETVRYDGKKERMDARDVKATEPMFVIVR